MCVLGPEHFACAGTDGSIRLWKIDGTLLGTLEGHVGQVFCIRGLTADRIASGGQDGTVRVWRSDGTLVRVLTAPTLPRQGFSEHWIRSIDVEGSDRVVAERSNGNVCVWRVDDGTLLRTFEKPQDEKRAARRRDRDDWLECAVEAHGEIVGLCTVGSDRFAYADEHGFIHVWTADGSLVQMFASGHVSSMCRVGNDRIACGSKDGTIRIWRIADGRLVRELKNHGDTVYVCALAGSRFASASDEGVHVWQADDFTHLQELEGQGVCSLGADRVATVDTRGWSISGDWGGTIRVWEADGILTSRFDAPGEFLGALGDEQLGTSTETGLIHVWRADGTLLYDIEGGSWNPLVVHGAHALSSGRFASTKDDGSIEIRRVADGTILQTLEGHRGQTHAVHMVGADRTVSTGRDGTLRVWLERDGAFEPEFVLLPRGNAVFRFTHASVRWPIALSRSDRPWAPADPELHELAAFTAADVSQGDDPSALTFRVPIHAFPDHEGELWSWSADRKTLYLAWPTDPEARRVLRRWVFGPKCENDPPP